MHRRLLFASACLMIPLAATSFRPPWMAATPPSNHNRPPRERPSSGTVRRVSRTFHETAELRASPPLPRKQQQQQQQQQLQQQSLQEPPSGELAAAPGDGVDKPPMSSSAAPAAKVKPEASPPVVSDSRKVLRALQANHGYALQTSFISSIHAIDRISREEEVLLSRAIQQSLQLNAAAPGESSSSASPARSPTFENVAAELDMDDLEVRAIFKAGLRARATLVTANLRLVQSAVNKAMRSERNSQVSRADLMQEGILGLIRAAEKFDSTKGFAFSTYATIWIRSTITHSLKQDAAIIRVPQQAVHMKRRVERARAEYKLAHGDLAEPTVEEIAMALGVTEKEVLYVLRRPVLMSSSAFDVGTENMVHHLLADKDEDSGGICVVERAQVAATLLDELRRVLSPTEWEALVLRYGLLPEHKGRILTYPEVAKLTNRTRAQSRHAVKMSVKKLQTPPLRAMLQPYLETF